MAQRSSLPQLVLGRCQRTRSDNLTPYESSDTWEQLFTELELLRRVASLVPPPRTNLTRFHGVFAPGAQLRPFRVPQAGVEEVSVAPQVVARKEPMKEKTPRVDFR